MKKPSKALGALGKHSAFGALKAKSGQAGSGTRGRYDESKHVRAAGGRFGNKAGAGDDAPRKPRAPAKAELAKAAKGRSLGERVTGDSTITLSVASNPKKMGTKAYDSFALYSKHTTVREYIANHPGGKKEALSNLKWDMDKGFIKFGPPSGKSPAAPKSAAAPKSVHHDEDIFSDGKKQMSFGQLKKIMGPEQAELFAKQPQIIKVAAAGSKRAKEIAAAQEFSKKPVGLQVDPKDADKLTHASLHGATIFNAYSKKAVQYDPHAYGSNPMENLYFAKNGLKKGQHEIRLAPGATLGMKDPPEGPPPLKPAASASKPGAKGAPKEPSERWDEANDSGYSEFMYSSAVKRVHAATGLKAVKASENSSVEFYTGSGYADLNSNLREGLSLPSSQGAHMKELDKLVSAQSFETDTYMYRGIGTSSYDDVNFNDVPPPPDFVDRGYSSVSFNPRVSADFSGTDAGGGSVMFRVRVPKGTPGVHVDREFRSDPLSDEAEVVLGRNTRYRYVGEAGQQVLMGRSFRIVEVEIVPHD